MKSNLKPSPDATPSSDLSAEQRVKLLREMLLVRRTEETIRQHYHEGDMRCPTHLSIGQEAVAAGICANLTARDYMISAHRSHAHYVNKGGDLRAMFAELYGKVDGCASGKGGSMHLIDLKVNFLGCVPIVGSTIPIGVGAAFGAKLKGEDAVTVICFGDGATESGVFHESMNFAAIHRLRVLFVCENNLYSVNTSLAERQPRNREIVDLARGHGIHSVQCDGQAVETVQAASGEIIEKMRREGGPAFMEFATYRYLEHCGPNDDLKIGYRPEGEFERWSARDPVLMYKAQLLNDGVLNDAGFEQELAAINARLDDALDFAHKSPFPTRDTLFRYLYAGA